MTFLDVCERVKLGPPRPGRNFRFHVSQICNKTNGISTIWPFGPSIFSEIVNIRKDQWHFLMFVSESNWGRLGHAETSDFTCLTYAIKHMEFQQFGTFGPSIFNEIVNISKDRWHFLMFVSESTSGRFGQRAARGLWRAFSWICFSF